MSPYVERIVERLREAEQDLAREVEEQEQRWHYRVHRGRVWFDKERRQAHRRLKQSVPAYIREGSVLSLLTAPVIYSLLLPLALLDTWVTIYQGVCFPIYGIARVPRRHYLVIDRHKLAYLNAIEKVHCTFCSYANGVIAYVREVAACTEQDLVPDQARSGHPDTTRALPPFLRLRQRRKLSPGSPRPASDVSHKRSEPCARTQESGAGRITQPIGTRKPHL